MSEILLLTDKVTAVVPHFEMRNTLFVNFDERTADMILQVRN